ncbi:replication protein A [Pseudomonas sp. PA-3-11C]|uniref:replication initiation protein n=1 Tax=unclassified Pseudomonas TaxID=196821 RepID=UPI001F1C3440|nr:MULTISPECIES: replication initiation protein [unclassified Pseudomonas]MCF5508494.1 replication protein A [Pseudomonas sp. PA-3-6H]MCF5516189.1 replication protein A [Pseudomonas sp. PA-3-6E]MCF5563928.1 replication protein A [Pseudomonas sp. PA-3-5D]MCF5566808.1 replication protein A [Pseudomonas sp. PA-3-11C]MCF5593745.1 replication protein A [Pseudomonas sp. PA-3-10C]
MDSTSKKQGTFVQLDDRLRCLPTAGAYTPSAHFSEDGTAFNRIVIEAPYLARCSDNKTATLVRPRDYAIRYPYMQINRRGMVSWLIFDLDHTNSLAWDDEGLPPPNLIVRNRNNGHSHLFYAIPPVCTTENARDKPIQYMKAVYAAFALRLKADPDYNSGPVAKTPGHPWWSTSELHNHVYELGELADYVELQVSPWKAGPQLEDLPHSRHCVLFEQLRYFAYSIVNQERERGNLATFSRRLEAFAHNHNKFARNGFSEDLMLSSVRATVRSVARWTWTRYQGSTRCCRGAMALDKSLPLAERQSLAAKRTHELRHKSTESKIRAACRGLQERGEKLTQVAIAILAGVSRQTVANYGHVLNEVTRAQTISVLGATSVSKTSSPSTAGDQGSTSAHGAGLVRTLTDVAYAVHQVTAPAGGALDPIVSSFQGEDSS